MQYDTKDAGHTIQDKNEFSFKRIDELGGGDEKRRRKGILLMPHYFKEIVRVVII